MYKEQLKAEVRWCSRHCLFVYYLCKYVYMCSEPQWTEKYCPTSSKDIIIGRKVIDEFMSWLCTWKDQIEKERQKLLLLEENEKKYRS